MTQTRNRLFHIQMDINVTQATRALAPSLTHTGLRDDSLLLKTTLVEATQGALIRPWRLHTQHGPCAIVLGYSASSPEDIQQRLELATPAVRQAVEAVYGHEMPSFSVGQRLRFALRMVPTIRVTGHGEQDAFLYAVNKHPDEKQMRGDVYTDYLTQRLAGASMDSVNLEGFQLRKLTRRKRDGWAQRTFPAVHMMGALTVTDAAAFRALLATGIGRQRGFGYGMLRLEAA